MSSVSQVDSQDNVEDESEIDEFLSALGFEYIDAVEQDTDGPVPGNDEDSVTLNGEFTVKIPIPPSTILT